MSRICTRTCKPGRRSDEMGIYILMPASHHDNCSIHLPTGLYDEVKKPGQKERKKKENESKSSKKGSKKEGKGEKKEVKMMQWNDWIRALNT